jgi:hypothetical protein
VGSLVIGGQGNDRVTLGGGRDIVAFNHGDGRDVVRGTGDAVLSLGGGIRYQDLALRRSGDDLVVEVGDGERITLGEWYSDPQHQMVQTMQVIAEAMQGSASRLPIRPRRQGRMFLARWSPNSTTRARRTGTCPAGA